jgi:hypothetical protein
MHHPFKENVIFINLRGEPVECTQKERDAFLKDNLALKYEDDRDIFLAHPQNVRFQNDRFQNVRFQIVQDIRITKCKVYKTSGLQNIRSSKLPVAKRSVSTRPY